MNDDVYRRLCMTSVCGAILIPVAMALVSELAADDPGAEAGAALVASAATAGPVSNGARANDLGIRRDVARLSSFPDLTTK